MEIDVTDGRVTERVVNCTSQNEIENSTTITTVNTTVANKEHENNNILNRKGSKHALRQQAKRRKKNTTIASGNAASLPRIIVKPLPQSAEVLDVSPITASQSASQAKTMREVLASIPGFNIKQRKRTNKKLSTAAQLEQTKEGHIDLETPDSILVNTNLRLLLNKATFSALPMLYQHKLIQLLPSVDRHMITSSTDPNSLELSNSGLNNEFFARACLEWQDRLAEGEFTPENQQKLKLEADKERSKLDPWKLKHFEPIWGDRGGNSCGGELTTSTRGRVPLKTTIKLRHSTVTSSRNKSTNPPPIKRLRTVGAMTRSCLKEMESTVCTEATKSNIPDLLPIKSLKPHFKEDPSGISQDSDKEQNSENSVERDNCIINISDTILQNDEETIIICRTNEERKRRRSVSLECLTASPLHVDIVENAVYTGENMCNDTMDDSMDGQDHKLSENSDPISDPIELDELDENKTITEYEDSNSSTAQDEMFHHTLTQNMETQNETVDLSELNCDIKDDNCYTDDSTTTDDKTEEEIDNSPFGDISDAITPNESGNDCTEPVDPLLLPRTEESCEKSDVDGNSSQDIPDTFKILPNTLILQQESVVLEKGTCSKICETVNCLEESAEKLKATVEESDFVIAQLTQATFNASSSIADEDANEARFIDAENYVLESGQITVSEKPNKTQAEVDIQATLFGNNIIAGGLEFSCVYFEIIQF